MLNCFSQLLCFNKSETEKGGNFFGTNSEQINSERKQKLSINGIFEAHSRCSIALPMVEGLLWRKVPGLSQGRGQLVLF